MAAYRAPGGPGGSTPSYLALTLTALPEIALQAILHLPVALLAVALWGIALGGGMAILRRAGYQGLTAGERAVFGGALGMGVLSLGTFLLGSVSGRPPWLLTALLILLLLGMAAVGLRDLVRALGAAGRAVRAWRREAGLGGLLTVVFGVLVIALALTRANVPVFGDYDSLEYHLGAPARWWRQGRVSHFPRMVYTNFPQGVEMLYLLAMSVFGGPMRGAAVGLQVGVGFVVLTAGAIAAFGRRFGAASAGRAGAAIYLATPMLIGLATQDSYVVELPLAAYAFLAFYAFLLARRADEDAARRRRFVLCGVMAGLAVGCKYPAVLFVLAPLVVFALLEGLARRVGVRRSLGGAALVGGAALLVASPWLVRNAVNTGNPVYPLLYDVFGGERWSARQDAKFAQAHRPSSWGLPDAARRFWAFAAWRDQPEGDWQPPWRAPAAPLLVLFAVVPLALSWLYAERPVFYAAELFLVAAALDRFGPGHSGALAGLPGTMAAVCLVGFLASPLLLRRRRELFYLHLLFVLWFVAWYVLTHRLDRFLDPATPALAVLAGVGVASIGRRPLRRAARGIVAAGLAFAAAVTLLLHVLPLYFGLTQTTDAYLSQAAQGSTYSHAAIRTINQLAPDAVVLFVGEARTFYCRRRAIAATVFDQQPIDRILERATPGDAARQLRQGLQELGVSHVYINWREVQRLGDSYAFRFRGRRYNGFSEHVNAEHPGVISEMRRRGMLRRVPLRDRQGQRVPPATGFVLYELR
jgi:4-amino-4-deoxy-L-arabinose transferase-like glycosyltransferase